MIDDLQILYWGLKSMDFEIQYMKDNLRRCKETYEYPKALVEQSEENLRIMEAKREEFRLLIERRSYER